MIKSRIKKLLSESKDEYGWTDDIISDIGHVDINIGDVFYIIDDIVGKNLKDTKKPNVRYLFYITDIFTENGKKIYVKKQLCSPYLLTYNPQKDTQSVREITGELDTISLDRALYLILKKYWLYMGNRNLR
jgi:hypothetical protein